MAGRTAQGIGDGDHGAAPDGQKPPLSAHRLRCSVAHHHAPPHQQQLPRVIAARDLRPP